MINPLLALVVSKRRDGLRRKEVPVPTAAASTDVIFLVLRRMRPPLLWLVGVFTVSVVGLSATSGIDASGAPHRLSIFESFYVMSYTATTIGFGELPQPFTTGQRLWVTFMIYATVIGWAYALATMLALAQDEGFTTARTIQRFRRRVRRLGEPFFLVVGYGESGRRVCMRLDALDQRCVTVDARKARIDLLEVSETVNEVPGLVGDAHDPAVLGLAGMGLAECCGVLVLTDDDDVNLAVVQSVALLHPEVPVIARASTRDAEQQMAQFQPVAVINPLDRFGDYLVLAVQRPDVYRLVSWLTSPTSIEVPARREPVASGTWTVCADGEFRDRVAEDLREAGFGVTFVEADGASPDVTGSVGCVVATRKDTTNLSIAARLRREHPGVLLCLRQVHTTSRALLAGFAPDVVFFPADVVARECLTRVVAPYAWALVEDAMHRDDAWAGGVLEVLEERCGGHSPVPSMLGLTSEEAPAVVNWLHRGVLTVGDLTRDPEDRDDHVPVVVAVLLRDGGSTSFPDASTPLAEGDELMLYCGPSGRARLRDVLFNDASVEYVATGRRVPATWVWRRLTHHRLQPVQTDAAGPAGR
ncbi:MAG: NAD-binding protein [Ornithinibacter sp.]